MERMSSHRLRVVSDLNTANVTPSFILQAKRTPKHFIHDSQKKQTRGD